MQSQQAQGKLQRQMKPQARKKPEEMYRDQVMQRLTAFEADESKVSLDFEPVGSYAEEQKMYRYIV